MPKKYPQRYIWFKSPISNYAFYASGFFQTLLSGAFGILIAFSLGAELRGEFALVFSCINLTIAFAFSEEKGNVIKNRGNLERRDISPLQRIFSTRTAIGTAIPLIFYIVYDTGLSLMSIIIIIFSIYLNGKLQLSAQTFLSTKEPFSATLATSGTWILMLFLFFISSKMDVKINIDYLVICLGLSSLFTFCAVRFRNIFHSNNGQNAIVTDESRNDTAGYFALNSFGSLFQYNGLVILFGLSHDLERIGVLSIATAIMNSSLSLLSSVILGRYWLNLGFTFKLYFASFLFLLIFSSILSFVIQPFLNEEFRSLYSYVVLLFPFYVSSFTTEVVINRSIHKHFFRSIVIFKFLNSLFLIPTFVICSLFQFNFFSSLLLVSCTHLLMMCTFYVFSGIFRKLG